MSADDGAVDDRADIVDFELELAEYEVPVPFLRPVGEAVVHRLPGTESLRQVTPRAARLGAIEHGVDEEAVTEERRRPCLLRRQNSLEPPPMILRKRMAVHGRV